MSASPPAPPDAPPRRRAVSVLEVASPALWDVLAAATDLEAMTAEVLSETRRVVTDAFDRELEDLRARGLPVLVRYARRSAEEIEASRHDLQGRIDSLGPKSRRMLHHAQRHAREDVVLGSHVWDPLHDLRSVRALLGAGLISALPSHEEPGHGRYHLHPDLPPPPPVAYDFLEADMPPTDDLSEPGPGPVDLLHDLASLSAALSHHTPRRTLSGSLDKATVRKLGRRLGSDTLAATGALAEDPRWSRALAALEALGAVSMDPISREISAEPDLESTLEGSTAEAVDRMVHRMVDRDLQAVLPAVRTAIAQCTEGAVDEMIFMELLAEQHREIVFARWEREGVFVYPSADDTLLPWTEEAFELVEGRLIRELFRVLQTLGLIRRAEGVFAATPDGLLWATGTDPAAPPVWVSGDLELLVPPGSVTPWERYQLERLGRCLQRDVVDRYRLDKAGLEAWLATHPLDDALDLLRRRSPGVPGSVLDALRAWAASVSRFVLTRGVLHPTA